MTAAPIPAANRRLPGAIAVLLLAAAAGLLVASASQAPVSGGFGDRDLQILRQWIASGRLAPLPHASDHLLKPGYLAYLRIVLGAREPFPIRRLLLTNAILLACGFAMVVAALWRSGRQKPALIAALVFLAYTPLRDANDYVLSEPVAAFGLLVCLAILIVGEVHPRALLLLGIPIALTTLVRPNTGEIALVLSLLVVASSGRRRGVHLVWIVLVSVSACAAVVFLGARNGIDVNPLGVRATNVFLWGAADYYWEADVGPWPEAPTMAEQRRLEARNARGIWGAKLRRWSGDDRRALAWKLGHAYLSCEQLPPRWQHSAYRRYDGLLRRWWWLIALVCAALAAGVAVGGVGPWRFAPALLVAAIVAQGLFVGADPRFALPFMPGLLLTLVLAIPSGRLSARCAGAQALVLVVGLGLIAAVPDAANSDFGVVRESRTVSLAVGPRPFRGTSSAVTLHVRILEPAQTFERGITITANGRTVARYDADPSRPEPPYLTAVVAGRLLTEARRSGLNVRIRPVDGPPERFLYFPVVPPPWAAPAAIDGSRAFESGYGGLTRGGIPFWIHSGVDAPLPAEITTTRASR